jgi:hypothetical protein
VLRNLIEIKVEGHHISLPESRTNDDDDDDDDDDGDNNNNNYYYYS